MLCGAGRAEVLLLLGGPFGATLCMVLGDAPVPDSSAHGLQRMSVHNAVPAYTGVERLLVSIDQQAAAGGRGSAAVGGWEPNSPVLGKGRGMEPRVPKVLIA